MTQPGDDSWLLDLREARRRLSALPTGGAEPEPIIPESESEGPFDDEQQSDTEPQSEPKPPAEWSDPMNLPPVTEAVPTMLVKILPEALAEWINDVADRLSVPVEYVALPAVSAAASVIGRVASIRPKRRDDWAVVPTLWGANIGGPGALKSPAIEQAMRPIKKLATQARLDFEGRCRVAQGDIAEREARIAAARKAIDDAVRNKRAPADKELAAGMGIEWKDGALSPEDEAALRAGALEAAKRKLADLQKEPSAQPIQKRYVTNDATTEKLGELLNENPRGLLLVRDELTGWLFSLEKSGREGDRAFFLESWEGIGSFDVDRIGRGSIHVPALTLSVFGGIQPDRLRQFFSGAMANGGELDGLLQRFQLLAWPDDPGEWCLIDRWPDEEAMRRAFAIFKRLDGMDAKAWGAKAEDDEIPFLRFASDAQALYDDWLTKLMHRVRSKELEPTPGFAAHLAKYPSLFPKLALVFHLIAVADGREPGPVSLEAAQLAKDWCTFLEAHARKVYAPELKGNVTAAHALAKKILAGAVVDGVTVREVWRYEWSGLRTSEIVYGALEVLEACHWTRVDTVRTGGAPSPTIRINPKLQAGPTEGDGR